FMLVRADLSRLVHEAPERQWLRQLRRAPLLQQADFLDDEFQRRMIQYQMMARHLQQPVLAHTITHCDSLDQWCPAHIDAVERHSIASSIRNMRFRLRYV